MFWFLGIGLFFTVTSIALMFDNFLTGLMGVVIGIMLIGIGLLLIKKRKPRVFQLLKEKKIPDAVKELFSKPVSSVPSVSSTGALTPTTYDGHERKYHYTDVNIVVKWEYGGQYGKSCKSIGIKRGDIVKLCKPSNRADNPTDIAVCWNGVEIGFMKSNRLKDMVHSWQAAKLPVLTIVSSVGGEEKINIEFAFYGSPSK